LFLSGGSGSRRAILAASDFFCACCFIVEQM
jgi:hypothetical protein